jgi:molybdopterin molybdotransferase
MEDLPMVSIEEGRTIVLDAVEVLESEQVTLVDALGRVAAHDLVSDIDITPFAHAAMDGFALKADQISAACTEEPVVLKVIAEVPAGSTYEGNIAPDECVRIMTGAPLPACADSVVKYELVDYRGGDGRQGSQVAFSEPTKKRSNVREAGEEIACGEVAIHAGEVIRAAGVGFLASCGITEVPVYRRPKVAIISIGSELVDPEVKPGPGQIRDGNAYALAACVKEAGAIPTIYPIVKDDFVAIHDAVVLALQNHDFVVSSGGASNGDYDFIKDVIEQMGELKMTLVNMRPGKAQAFGLVEGVAVLGLSGNPAAAYCGFEMFVRPALRKMQGFSTFARPTLRAALASDRKKKDARCLLLRASLEEGPDERLRVVPAKNQNSGLFSTLQRGTCLALLPAGVPEGGRVLAGTQVDCILLDVEEGTVIA